METSYHRWFSPALDRDMECKVYGHGGRPVLYIPCQDGRFYDFENFHMTDSWSPWIDTGEVTVFSIDTVDGETWSDRSRDAHWRIRRYEQWIRYITEEIIPFIHDTVSRRRSAGGHEGGDRHWGESGHEGRESGWDQGQGGHRGVLVFGCSLGAAHAANLYFRRPDLFDGVLALSGIYSADYGFDGYMDEVVYQNSPVHCLPNMPDDHPYIDLYRQRKAIFCTGQGPWEKPEATRLLGDILERKHISAWVDYWGHDSSHDWYWWRRQVSYYVPYLLGKM